MAAIDPALLHAQWLQYQQSQLAQSAIIPQATQFVPAPIQPQGEFLNSETIAALTGFMNSANSAAMAAANYIDLLESLLAEHKKLIDFSAAQDELIWKFLHDREFTLDYIRGAWIREAISDEFMSQFANVYLEIDALSPRGNGREYSGNPNTKFDAMVTPQQPQYQNIIPPLPSSNGNATPYITMDQYLAAQQQGEIAAARAAAMQNPAGLYAAFLAQAAQ
jgi:hypothetical protein